MREREKSGEIASARGLLSEETARTHAVEAPLRVAWHGSRLPEDPPKWVPRVMFFGQAETDKWPLVLARGCGRATSDHGRRRGRVSFDG